MNLATAAVDSFGRGDVELAGACRAPFALAAADPTLPAVDRWAALEALARLSTLEAELPAISTVIDLQAQLPLSDDVRAPALRVRIDLGALMVLAGRTDDAGRVLEGLDTELAAAGAPLADRLRAQLYQAWVQNDSGQPARARVMATEVFERRRALLGNDDAETNLARLSVAAMAYEAGSFSEARQAYAEAAKIFGRTLGPRHPYPLRARRGVAIVAMASGHLETAIRESEITLRDAREGRADDDPEVIALNVLLAQVRLEGGRPAQAQTDLLAVLPLLVRRYGEDDDRTLQARDSLSTVCLWLGDTRCALDEAGRVVQGYAGMGPPTDVRRLGAEAKYASALLLVGRFEEGVRRLEKAVANGLPVHGARNRWIGALLQDLAVAYLNDGRPSQAIAPLQTIVDAYGDGADADLPHPRLLSERLLASAWLATGQPGKALALLDASIQRRRVAFGSDHPLTRAPLVERAQALVQLGDPAAALADAEAALAGFAIETGSLWRERFAARVSRAQALDALGRGAAALDERRLIVRDVEAIRTTLDDSPAVRQAYLREWIPQYKRLAIDAAASGLRDEAFRIAELARSRTLLEVLASQQADRSGPTAAHDRARLAALTGRLGVLDEAIAVASDEARVAIEAERRRAADQLALERSRIAASDPRYAALLGVPRADPAQASRVLETGDLYLSYTVLDGRLLTIGIDEYGAMTTSLVDIGGSLRDAIEGWRAWLMADPDRPPSTPVWLVGDRVVVGVLRPSADARRATSADEVGAVLTRWLIEPLRAQVAAARRLVIAPDPALALLPFDALPWRGSPLVRSHEIAQVQSFGVLSLLRPQRLRSQGRTPTRVLVVADPDYRGTSLGATHQRRASAIEPELGLLRFGESGAVDWPRLPGSRREGLAVARLFPQSRVLLDGAASEAALQELAANGRLRDYDVLHFATHGVISQRQPWASALVLAAPAPFAPGDGYLTAAEFGQLGLTSRLVVMSACDTATGNALEGEGVLGFPYVLLAAGATSTMLTLWAIDDDVSAKLMAEVMQGVRAGLPPSRALAQAQRKWIARGLGVPARTWAGLVVYGL
ncbi:MAG: CHAT domain-containing protein [Burkholderiaceae bacterium]